MKPFRWSPEKNDVIQGERGVSFERVVVAVESGALLDITEHPNPAKYPRQRIMVVAIDQYAYLVPFVDEEDHYFLKTVIPSRKATQHYFHQGEPDVES